ncbi:MAG: S8 family serine peptidase [Kurthia sp.]|nr:S8 family serine peptidase [Candidatus Kurthia equi]
MKKYGYLLSTFVLTSSLILTSPMNVQAVENQTFLSGQTKDTSLSENYEKNKLIVQTSSNLSANQLKKLGATVSHHISALNYTVLQFKTEKAWKMAVKTLSTTKGVKKISLSPIYKKLGVADPKASQQYMHSLLKSANAQNLIGKNKVKVAIIDGGIDIAHPDVKSQIIQSKNMVNPLHTSVSSSHGTHVAGIVAATKNNGIGGYGINPSAQLLGYDVFDGQDGAYDYIIAKTIVQAAKDGAKVINMSLGSAYSSDIMADAIKYANNKGVTIVAAAGNEGNAIKQYPASYEGVISVGSVNSKSTLSSYSSYGISTDIVAPGEEIYSSSFQKRGSSFENMSGTSMASPVVAAVVSLILSKNSKLTPNQVEYILEHSATDLGAKGFDVKYGNGLVNPVAALKFDTKKIPSLSTKKWTDEQILNDADDAKFNQDIQGTLQVPFEEKWVRIPVMKGQKIQLAAIGDQFADLKLAVNFYNSSTSQKTTYNQAYENELEAKYFEAPFDGTMTVGISDVNGLVSKQPFTLQIQTGEFPDDESSREEIAEIDSLTSEITDQYMQPMEAGDEDVLHFKATKNELVQVDISGIPGVKTAIQIYDKKNFLPDEYTEALEKEEEFGPIAEFNNTQQNSTSTVSFETKKDEDYYIVLNNKPVPELTFELLIQMLVSGNDIDLLEPTPEPSLFPYTLLLQSKDIPADEDQLGTGAIEVKEGEDEIFYENTQQQFEALGRPLDLTKQTAAYINGSNDVDGYYFTTTQSAIYDLGITTFNKATIPYTYLYEVNTIMNENNEPEISVDYVSDNYNQANADGSSLMMGLKANTTYLLEVTNGMHNLIPFDGYTLEPKLLKQQTEDKHEANNTVENATNFPSSNKVEGNIATFNDIDYYYFNAKNTGIYSVDYQLKKLTATNKKSLPEKLRNRYLSELAIVQDKNNNKRLDSNEYDSLFNFSDVGDDLSIHGSFEMKKGENYFISVTPYLYEYFTFSALPYELRLKQAALVDEDRKNKVTKNTPSKPIAFIKKSSKSFEKEAYMNSGYTNGDVDWFVYNSDSKHKITVNLATPRDLDGVLEIYKNGKRIAKADYYGDGDSEKLVLNASKGKYYIKVTDRLKRASVESYKLTIKK